MATPTTAYYGGLALSVNGALSYTLSDGLGSVSASVATNGMVSATQLYCPYGSVCYSSRTTVGTKAYTGQRADAVVSLYYDSTRYSDPAPGQFTNVDLPWPRDSTTISLLPLNETTDNGQSFELAGWRQSAWNVPMIA